PMGACKKPPPAESKSPADSAIASTSTNAPAAENSPVEAASPAAVATGPRPANAPVVPVILSDPGNPDKTLAELNEALRKFSFENRRLPKSFSEVIAAGYVQPAPQPPPGKKFEIDSRTKHVILVNQ